MERSKIEMFLSMNASNFSVSDLAYIEERLEKLPDDKAYMVHGLNLQKPETIFIIALVLGWERFWLDDAAVGIVKIITFYGCGVWWLIDIVTAKERAMKYNFSLFNRIIG